MFGEEGTGCENIPETEKALTHDKYLIVKKEYMRYKKKAKNEYDYYNLIEKSILDMEVDDDKSNEINAEEL